MYFDILIFLFYIIVSAVGIMGYGILFKKKFFTDNQNNLGEIGLLGFFILFFISIVFHFFISLSIYFNFTLLIIGVALFFINFHLLSTNILKYYKYILILSLILLTSAITLRTNADFEWYHLPYINYLNDYKIIFGLVNLSNSYAYGHGWLDTLGLFTMPLVGTKGLTVISLIFYFFFILYFIYEFINEKKYWIKIFSFILILFTLLVFNRLKDFGAEIQPTFILLILIYNILKFFDSNSQYFLFEKIIIYAFYAIILRIGSVIILPLIFAILLIEIKNLFKYLFLNIKIYLFIGKITIN